MTGLVNATWTPRGEETITLLKDVPITGSYGRGVWPIEYDETVIYGVSAEDVSNEVVVRQWSLENWALQLHISRTYPEPCSEDEPRRCGLQTALTLANGILAINADVLEDYGDD